MCINNNNKRATAGPLRVRVADVCSRGTIIYIYI